VSRFSPFTLALLTAWLGGALVRADHLAIELTVQSAKVSKTAHAEMLALGVKPKARGLLEVKAGDAITVKWVLSSTDAKATVKDVLVHFFVVKEEKAGQAAIPKLDKDVIAESALTVDFKPKDKVEGELSFTIARPGTYLLRLETRGAAGKDGHEHFAALDLLVR
jgi:hypothetical protein